MDGTGGGAQLERQQAEAGAELLQRPAGQIAQRETGLLLGGDRIPFMRSPRDQLALFHQFGHPVARAGCAFAPQIVLDPPAAIDLAVLLKGILHLQQQGII